MEIAFKASPLKMKAPIVNFVNRIKKLGKDDPRRIVHSFKVALAITLVSMVYYLRPLYKGMGEAGIWAILTVVVVFEYTAGATLCKGMNRGLATLLAGALGLGAEYLASLFGPKVEPIVLGCFVFLLVAAATFSRFIPHIKRRYDYGVLIFILTFSLVAVSGYRVDKIIELAHQRLSTIILGGATCIIISICVCPVWAGEDLHNLIVSNLEKLASFLDGFGGEIFDLPLDGDSADISNEQDKSSLAAYKSVLNSKATEESLANFAWWEPGHGKFGFSHPWKQYLKIGVVTRQCAYHIEALNGYLDPKFQGSSEFRKIVQEPCMKMSSEAGKALKELAVSIKSFSYPCNFAMHIQSCTTAVNEVNTTLQASMVGEWEVLEIIPIITVISILIDIIKCVETIFLAIEELSEQAHFKKSLNENEKPQLLHGDERQDKGFVTVIIHNMASASPAMKDSRG
ncbi:aluminum-activated malate transporter 8-like [Cynara cardunculus var. scolymus]|uniref:aluminum-activated malate transporter 8-like n=1 Tax=Cynara cardunculus var. scolymus TaxID=59895 RepID=UPI000D624EC1|nr:aluminum-activated malate transporter 8-like [Cynara cardunculus var. scolymus]